MSLKINHSLTRLVREKQPVIHCITNYVTAGDVANTILACGGSPIMADHHIRLPSFEHRDSGRYYKSSNGKGRTGSKPAKSPCHL